ncbi:hypothetical protein [Parachryseolinea silvisoli]|uniref:hypothetical protein n=1 Tax=Parachryseolinea silvisoli TaxID=2873601 RepID=UPI002265C322|nr:hypothetical protein [Parachryseolinea silvisoli]MCD9019892.1 hypothetical protein [Parachryseolinea silvisoli]
MQRLVRPLLLLLWIVAISAGVYTEAHAQRGKLTKIPVNTRSANPKGYIEYLPPNYVSTRKYPVLYWMHGLEGVGSGTSAALDKLMSQQISNWLKTNDVDFIILVPQDASGYWNGSNSIARFVEWAKVYYKSSIDLNQQHMAGLSSGGYGIRDFIVGNSATYKAFSTFTPMSTNLDGAVSRASQIVSNNQYVWIHQGKDDVTPNQLASVANFHNAVYKLDSRRSRLTAYLNLGHSAWDKVYNGTGRTSPQVTGTVSGTTYYNWTTSDPNGTWFGWLLSHPKTGAAPPPASGTAPTAIALSNTSVGSGAGPGTAVGTAAANGTAPVTTTLVSGAYDNARFSLQNNQLTVASSLAGRTTYTIQLQAANSSGSIRQAFTITVGQSNGTTYTVSPNPVAGNSLNITPQVDNVFFNAILVLDPAGVVRARYINVPSQQGVPLTFPFDMTPGMYTLQIWRRNAPMETMRVAKQ